MACAVSHSLVEILAFLPLMQHAVMISTAHCVEQGKAAKQRVGRASWSWRSSQINARRGRPVQGGVHTVAQPSGMWPQVGAFGFARGIYLRTVCDMWQVRIES